MRFMLVGGSRRVKNKVNAYYEISVRVRGGSRGIIGSGISAECPASMIVASDGTLLVATGYGPMLRMRQNESKLTTAGVPPPKQQIMIATGVDLGYQSEMRAVSFDYSRFGTLKATFNATVGAMGFRDTAQGTLSSQARQVDFNRFMTMVPALDNELTEITVVNGLTVNPHQPADSPNDLVPYRGTIKILPVGPGYDLPIRGSAHSYSANANQNTASKWRLNSLFLGTYNTNVAEAAFSHNMGNWKQNWINTAFTLQMINQAGPLRTHDGYSGRYQCFMRYVDKDGKVSDPSPMSSDTVIDGEPCILYTNLEVPTDPKIARRQIFRNEHGNSDTFYLDIDTDDLTSTMLYSLNTDSQLKLNYPLDIFDDNGQNQLRLYGQPPDDKPYIAEFNSLVFAAGFRIYSTGNVSVTNGSTEMTGIGTEWVETFVGRQVIVGNVIKTIVRIDPDTQIMTVDEPYEGPTEPYLDYAIKPYSGNSALFYWSESGEPEYWPAGNALQLPQDNDDITGLKVFASSLWILKNNAIYQFNTTINPGLDGDYKPATNRGCISQRCAIEVQNVCLMLDRVGIHVFKGYMPRYNYQADSTPDHLSYPVDDLFRFEGDWLRINWDSDKCFWHGVHNREFKVARYFVTMRGYDYPQHAICTSYMKGEWWIEEYPFPIISSAQSNGLGGSPILGGREGKIYIPDRGSLDVIDSGQTRFNVTNSYGGVTLVLDGVPPACEGLTIAIVSGRGHGQSATILAQDGNEIDVDVPFFPEPDETSVVQIGAIHYYLETAEYDFAKLEIENAKRFGVEYQPTEDPLEVHVAIDMDGIERREVAIATDWGAVSSTTDDPEWYKINLQNIDGCGVITLDSKRERDVPQKYCMQAVLDGYSGVEKPVFSLFYFVGASMKKDYTV